ncbi:MAG: uncharacterized protein JWP16_334 [Alphaproteobacteria bacterium]|nr:uncharacterized protein [Alphaproteobacteria bacterium]MDB5739294.1 uncharacterized protein [Alphaproteobacteria bacterium]
MIRKFLIGLAAAAAIICVAAPAAEAQYWGGHRYCWYDGGWHGPGYYRCGWRLRHGFGWGGGIGWNGWGGGGHYRGGYHGGGFGGGHHGGGGFHGGGHGGSHGGNHGGGGHHR